MTASKKEKNRRAYQFEISRGGLLAVSVATLVILLSMFVLGLWVGKDSSRAIDQNLESMASGPTARVQEQTGEGNLPLPPVDIKQEEVPLKPKAGSDSQEAPGLPDSRGPEEEAKVLYTLQIASLRDVSQAEDLKAIWEKKGYAVFINSRNMPPAGAYYYVQIGRFATVGEANAVASRITERDKIRPYITTVSVPSPAVGVAKE